MASLPCPRRRIRWISLGKDVLALMDALDIPKAMFCGLSMGGMTGMWLGVNAPDRFSRLALCNIAAKIGTDHGLE